ncbi:MAG: hypothetical protein P8K76_02260 [Candidatus Binatia bacterium]|nr:hypothetical protein [Candidatus Binatia bacterium]MDG2008581.1 hypothetical protein [Candidatus Binatia bacterium]HAC81631.1 hypothetical protein [Deltaproteobacteria bacterium]
MLRDFAKPLHALKLGALINLYLLADTTILAAGSANATLLLPAQILFAVSAYRCIFPVRYKDNIVLHDSFFSSIFLTRFLATFAEIAFIFQFASLLQRLNLSGIEWIDWLSWAMVAQVTVSQIFVWWAILSRQLVFYYYEEIGWFLIFVANTFASGWLLVSGGLPQPAVGLLELNLLFGAFYLPWQVLHIRSLRKDAFDTLQPSASSPEQPPISLGQGFSEALFQRQRRTDATSWGGWIGLVWMVGYWATLIPLWAHHVATAGLD